MEHLGRLTEQAYLGRAYVHWNFTIEDRKRGWLDERFHLRFRERLLHALARYHAACPTYCLMPDHVHLLIIGSEDACNQKNLVRHLRKTTNDLLSELGDFSWQKQPYDNVLRQKDREREAFCKVARYIIENPVNAGMVAQPSDWPYVGCMVPGYPILDIHNPDYWPLFWKIYCSL
jgi:putative transposase